MRARSLLFATVAAACIGAISAVPASAYTGRAGDVTWVFAGGGEWGYDGRTVLGAVTADRRLPVFDVPTRTAKYYSLTASGAKPNAEVYTATWKPKSRSVVYETAATNVGFANPIGAGQVYIKDLVTGTIRLVSASADGTAGDNLSYFSGFSPDGSKVLLTSFATNLGPGDPPRNKLNEVYAQVYVKDLVTGSVALVSRARGGGFANNDAGAASWSPDGSRVAFVSEATNVVPGDIAGVDLFVVPATLSGNATRITSHSEGPYEWSPNGDRIAYATPVAYKAGARATMQWRAKRFSNNSTQCLTCTVAGTYGNRTSGRLEWSPDGSRVAFESDASNFSSSDRDGLQDVFVKNLSSGVVRMVSTSSSGKSDRTHISYLAEGYPWSPSGRDVAFWSWDSTLVPGDTNNSHDGFVKHLWTGVTEMVSSTSLGKQANGDSTVGSWNKQGSYLLFFSDAPNLPGPTQDTGIYGTYVKRY